MEKLKEGDTDAASELFQVLICLYALLYPALRLPPSH